MTLGPAPRLALIGFAVGAPAACALASPSPLPLGVALVVGTAIHALADARRVRLRHALALTALASLVLLVPAPRLSTDAYRFAFEGRVLASGRSPYAHAPDDPALASLARDEDARINHPHLASAYPPVALAAFASVHRIGVRGPKVLAALAHLGLVLVLAGRARRRPDEAAGLRAAASALATSPFVLVEGALEGHFEMLAALPLTAAALTLRDGAARRAAGLAAIATLTKLGGVFLAPAVARRSRSLAAVTVALVVACALGIAAAGTQTTGGFARYASAWSGGSPGYAVVERALDRALARCCTHDDGRIHGRAVDGVVAFFAARGLPIGTDHYALPDATPRPGVHRSVLVPRLARAVVGVVLVAAYVLLARRRDDPVKVTRDAALVTLAFVPRLLPWYAVWLVPLDALIGGRAGTAFVLLALVGHASDEPYVRARLSLDPLPFTLVVAVLVLVLLRVEKLPEATGARREPTPG